ncbi:MAG: hypothetical protein AB7N70_35150 [Dehalococcoidia bacterium]
MLGLVLDSFLSQEPMRYEAVRQLFDYREGEYRPVTRLFSELNRLLHGALGAAISAKPNMKWYEVDQLIPYCWIRRAGAPSLFQVAG